MLRDGVGCEKNSAAANRRFQEAFLGFTDLERQSHDDKLQYRLGWMLANGIGTEKDIAQAKRYLERSAAVGNPFACFLLAKLILSEEAPSQEMRKRRLFFLGRRWMREIPTLRIFSASCIRRGVTFPKNIAEAMRLSK
jgi:TPR repeat protein